MKVLEQTEGDMTRAGLQIYTLRKQAEVNLFETIRKIAEAGYQGVEFDAGMLKRSDPQKLKSVLEGTGLDAIGLTVLMTEMGDTLDPLIEYAVTIGAEWLVMPWINEDLRKSLTGYETVAHALNKAAKRCSGFGLRFAYHIHGYEFSMFDEKSGMDVLFETLDPLLVELQLDTFWIASAGVDYLKFSEENLNWIGSFHMKDAAGFDPLRDTEVGEGILELQSIVDLAVSNGIDWLIVEQEDTSLPVFESVRTSLDNLNAMINKHQSA